MNKIQIAMLTAVAFSTTACQSPHHGRHNVDGVTGATTHAAHKDNHGCGEACGDSTHEHFGDTHDKNEKHFAP